MNIYDAVYQVNQNGLSRRAASIALADGGERVYTYGELFFKADAYAAGLTAAGVRAGDRVALVGASSPEWTAAFLAVCKCRCTAALLDASLGKEALLEFSKDADVRAAFWSDAAAQKLALDGGDMDRTYNSTFFNFVDYRLENPERDLANSQDSAYVLDDYGPVVTDGEYVEITHSASYKTRMLYDAATKSYTMQQYYYTDKSWRDTVDENNDETLTFPKGDVALCRLRIEF